MNNYDEADATLRSLYRDTDDERLYGRQLEREYKEDAIIGEDGPEVDDEARADEPGADDGYGDY